MREIDLYQLLKNGFEIWDDGKELDVENSWIFDNGDVFVRLNDNEDGSPGTIHQILGDEIKIIVKVEED